MTRPDSFTVPLPLPGNSDGDLLTWMGVDAVRWARLFQRSWTADCDQLGTLIGWFANAIEAGRDAGRAASPHGTIGDVDDRLALRRLQEQDRSTYGQRDVLVAAAALAIVEAIDTLAVTVRQMAAVLDGLYE